MKDIKKLENLKEQYNNIEIPTELDSIISTAIDKKPNILSVYFRKISVVAASIIVIFTSVVNISPAFAQSMSNIPVVSSIVKLVNFKTYTAKQQVIFDILWAKAGLIFTTDVNITIIEAATTLIFLK